MRGRLVAGALVLAAAGPVVWAAAVEYDSAPWSELPAIVLVNSCGTGGLVRPAGSPGHDAAYVLTAAHVIAPAAVGQTCPVRYWSTARGREETATAEVVASDPTQDAVLLCLAGPAPGDVGLAVGESPAVGQTVTAYGFQVRDHRLVRNPKGEPLLHVATGPVLAVGPETLRLSTGQRLGATMARIPFAAEGMSGGPVVDEAARVVALLSGIGDQGEGVATCGASSLAALLTEWTGPAGEPATVHDPLRAVPARAAAGPPGAETEPRGGLAPKGLAVPSETAVPVGGAPVLAPAAQAVQAGASASAAGRGPEPAPSPAVSSGDLSAPPSEVEVVGCERTNQWAGPALSRPGEARLAGRVCTAEGRPVRGVVLAFREGVVVAVAQVDPQGNEFDLGWLPAGTYDLQLALEQYPLHTAAALQLEARTQLTVAWNVAR